MLSFLNDFNRIINEYFCISIWRWKIKKKLNEKIERFCSQKALQVSIMNIKRYIKFY